MVGFDKEGLMEKTKEDRPTAKQEIPTDVLCRKAC
jgi:hypothetical protein